MDEGGGRRWTRAFEYNGVGRGAGVTGGVVDGRGVDALLEEEIHDRLLTKQLQCRQRRALLREALLQEDDYQCRAMLQEKLSLVLPLVLLAPNRSCLLVLLISSCLSSSTGPLLPKQRSLDRSSTTLSQQLLQHRRKHKCANTLLTAPSTTFMLSSQTLGRASSAQTLVVGSTLTPPSNACWTDIACRSYPQRSQSTSCPHSLPTPNSPTRHVPNLPTPNFPTRHVRTLRCAPRRIPVAKSANHMSSLSQQKTTPNPNGIHPPAPSTPFASIPGRLRSANRLLVRCRPQIVVHLLRFLVKEDWERILVHRNATGVEEGPLAWN